MQISSCRLFIAWSVGIITLAVTGPAWASEKAAKGHAAPPAAAHQPAPAHGAPAAAAPKPASGHGAPAAAPKAASGHGAPTAAPAADKPAEHAVPAPEPKPAGPTPDQILKLMKDGNKNFIEGVLESPNTGRTRRADTAARGQKPVATVISCSDSRVPVELIFDRGVGDLFVIRVAGNVCDTDEIGTAEYGVDHLGTTVLLVMGHTKCGAVTAVATGAQLHGHIVQLAAHITPAVQAAKEARPQLSPEALVPEAIKANIWHTIEELMTQSEIIREQAKAGKVRIEGAIYDITDGTVEWLGQHPKQTQLLEIAASPAPAHHAETAAAQPPAAAHAEPAPAPTHAPEVTQPKQAAVHAPATTQPQQAAAHAPVEQVLGAHPAPPPAAPAIPHDQLLAAPRTPATPPAEHAAQPAHKRPDLLPAVLERCMAEELYHQGLAELDAGDYTKAAEKLQSASRLDPSMLAAQNDLAGVFCLQQRYVQALETYNAVLATDPQYVEALRGSALCYASLKQYTPAQTALRKVLEIDRQNLQARLDLGDVCFLGGDAQTARQLWEAVARSKTAGDALVKQANLRINAYGSATPAPSTAR